VTGRRGRPDEILELEAGLERLVAINTRILATRDVPPLRDARVIYQGQETETWRSVAACLEAGRGDVEDLAAWLCAELRAKGSAAHVGIKQHPKGLTCVVIVGRGANAFEIDPVDWLRGKVEL
jgi:hypothetical protein